VVEMQVAVDILRLLFFPGIIFMAFCGFLVLFLESRLRTAFYGGSDETRLHSLAAGGRKEDIASAGELAAAALSLAAMGVAGVMLIAVKGDLFSLALLFTAAEMLPLFLLAASGNVDALRVPLFFRAAFYRMVALVCIVVSVSLRFPAAFSPGLESFREEGAFSAVQLWSGTAFGLILASLVCAVLAFCVMLLGRPVCGERPRPGEGGAIGEFYALAAGGAHRAASLLLLVLLFLGYPWDGLYGLLTWAAAALGSALVLTVLRAWLEGRDVLAVRKLQAASISLALLSLALAVAAVVISG